MLGIGLRGSSPLCEVGPSKRSVYQMTTSRELARDGFGEGALKRAGILDFVRFCILVYLGVLLNVFVGASGSVHVPRKQIH